MITKEIKKRGRKVILIKDVRGKGEGEGRKGRGRDGWKGARRKARKEGREVMGGSSDGREQ